MCDREEWRDAVRSLTEMQRAATANEHWTSKGMIADEPEHIRNER